jgi:hypothetical protein
MGRGYLLLLLTSTLSASGSAMGATRQPSGTVAAGQSPQRVTSLSDADSQRLRDQRAVVEKYLGDESSRTKYKTAPGKLGTIRAILDGNVFKPNETHKLQCLGVVLGDAFVLDLRMEWVMVDDGQGRDPALRLPGTSVLLFPLTMISKRIERGEKVDVFDLFNGVAAEVEVARRRSK